jgi:uncharacterized integral membrane protein
MVRKLITAVILVPLVIILVMFAVANRETITITFDPFDSVQPAFAFKLPLYLLIFALIAIGVVIGGLTTWFKQHKWRTRARRAEAETRALREQLSQRSKWPPEDQRTLPPPPDQPATLVFPPAA